MDITLEKTTVKIKYCVICGNTFPKPYGESKKRWDGRVTCSVHCRQVLCAKIKEVPISERFWLKVTKGDEKECWNWIGYCNREGYGLVGIGGSGNSKVAHRVSWMLTNGPIPDGLKVLHKCDNPPCVNPSHLFLGTDLDNAIDSAKKGRKIHKLTEINVKEIRNSKDPSNTLACKFNVGHQYIDDIRSMRARKYV